MWSVGCIFAEMVNKSTLFKANTIIEMRSSIIKYIFFKLELWVLLTKTWLNLNLVKSMKKV